MPAGAYYERQTAEHIDGTPIFKTPDDERSENEVARMLEDAWNARVRSFGRLSPIDWFAERDGRMVGVAELKTRSHAADRYPTVFLNVRKWVALMLASTGLGVPALFVVRFTDGVRWTKVADIDAGRQRIGGCVQIVKARSDVEPVIEVPVLRMRAL